MFLAFSVGFRPLLGVFILTALLFGVVNADSSSKAKSPDVIEASSIRQLHSMVRERVEDSDQFYSVVAKLVYTAVDRDGVNFQDDRGTLYVEQAPSIAESLIDQPAGCLVKVTCHPFYDGSARQKYRAISFEVLDPSHRIKAVPARIKPRTIGTPFGRLGAATGVVREIYVGSKRTRMLLTVDGETSLRAVVSRPVDVAVLRKWERQKVAIEGCVARHFGGYQSDAIHELLLMNESQVSVVEPRNSASMDDGRKAVPVDRVDRFCKDDVRVSLNGTVVYSDGVSTLGLVAGKRRYMVLSKFVGEIELGKRVVVEGVNAWDHRKDVHVIESRIIHPVELGEIPDATSMTAVQLVGEKDLPTRVQVRGRVQKSRFHDHTCTLYVEDGRTAFRASVSLEGAGRQGYGFSLKPNSLVEISGMPIRSHLTREAGLDEQRVTTIMAASADVRILEQPYYVSQGRVFAALATIVALLATVLVWTRALRRQVAVRTKTLHELSNRMHTAFEALREAVLIVDASGKIVFVNQRFSQIFGFEPLLDRPIEHLLSVLRTRFGNVGGFETLSQHWRSRTQTSFSMELESDNARSSLQVYCRPITESSVQTFGHLCVFDDVTEQQGLQAELAQSQKMEAVGRLAGGIAHDFNNFLTVIRCSLSAITLGSGETDQQCIDAANTAVDQARDLTQQLLGFARRSRLDQDVVSVNRLNDDVHSLLAGVIKRPVEFQVENNDSDLYVNVDVNRIEHVLINLCLNAYDEVRDKSGEILISACRCNHSELGDCACLSIRDNGPGIREEAIHQIFDPFFTTKDVGLGTGLGLSVALGIVKQHGGEIQVDSQIGIGTEFKVFLPLVTDPNATSEQDAGETQTQPMRIMVVDDEPLIRESLVVLLEDLQHTVVTAENGMQVIRHLALGSHFDLILLDMRMPEMSGWETYQEIRSSWPDQRVVFCSGYSGESIDVTLEDRDAPRVLTKPICPVELQSLLV